MQQNITTIRRVRKSDNNRIARAVGATIVNRAEDLREADVGTNCGLFHIEKLGDEWVPPHLISPGFPHLHVQLLMNISCSSFRYFTFLTKCTTPKACTILLRGPSKDILNEIDRNLADAMSVARNVVFSPSLAPGGGATEMAISVGLSQKAKTVQGVEGWPFQAVADAMEVIPRTLVQNAGGNAIRVLTELRVRLSLNISLLISLLPCSPLSVRLHVKSAWADETELVLILMNNLDEQTIAQRRAHNVGGRQGERGQTWTQTDLRA